MEWQLLYVSLAILNVIFNWAWKFMEVIYNPWFQKTINKKQLLLWLCLKWAFKVLKYFQPEKSCNSSKNCRRLLVLTGKHTDFFFVFPKIKLKSRLLILSAKSNMHSSHFYIQRKKNHLSFLHPYNFFISGIK